MNVVSKALTHFVRIIVINWTSSFQMVWSFNVAILCSLLHQVSLFYLVLNQLLTPMKSVSYLFYIIFIEIELLQMFKVMKLKKFTYFWFVVALCFSIESSTQQNQNLAKNLSKNTQKQAKNTVIIEVQTIGYLKNVLKLDLIINFLHCNKTLGFSELKYHQQNIIYESKTNNYLNTRIDSKFKCQKFHPRQKPNKNDCIFCKKQFKNESYLAIHYSIYHLSQIFPQREGSKTSNSQKAIQVLSTIQYILSQNLYSFVNPNDLKILFSSQASQKQIFEFCLRKFSIVSQHYNKQPLMTILDRYEEFFRTQNNTDLCLIIALKIGEENVLVNVLKLISIFFLLILGISYLVYLVFFMPKKADQKKEKHKYKRY